MLCALKKKSGKILTVTEEADRGLLKVSGLIQRGSNDMGNCHIWEIFYRINKFPDMLECRVMG